MLRSISGMPTMLRPAGFLILLTAEQYLRLAPCPSPSPMSRLTASAFVSKWRNVELTERSASQQHFLDLCEVVEHPKPAEVDQTGSWFTFERGAVKRDGRRGWADVWKRDYFGWEYKGKRKNLDAAFDQLLLYRESLENPPLLVVCDMDRFRVHTNFTAAVNRAHEIPLEHLPEPENLEILRSVFHEPARLKPKTTVAGITKEVAERLAGVAQSLRARAAEPTAVARFLDRIVFCLFAEDVGLLPRGLFTRITEKARDPEHFSKLVGSLFDAMSEGGDFGLDTIRYFNGGLFTDSPVLTLTLEEIGHIKEAARLDWGAVDPSIFGTLFERGLDPDKRAQLGAQYTSREDIETLIEPVVMSPLRREWAETRDKAEAMLVKLSPQSRRRAQSHIRAFLERLFEVKVLDPACGSGNFLYVTLQKLKGLEKEVLIYAQDRGLGSFLPHVNPTQFYGIEVNPYAFDLAQTTLWIGYLQWIHQNGYGTPAEPILRPMTSFSNMDAVLDLSDPSKPREPVWPTAEFIVGNPPFLGGKRLRAELSDEYVNKLFQVYRGRVPAEADLVTYWFEKGREQVEKGECKRAGFLATQGIRGGANREVLKRIKESGDIFFAESDRPWVLDGANVHVSMVGFDNGAERERILDNTAVLNINSNLTSTADITQAAPLAENLNIAFMGDTKGGAFDIQDDVALGMLREPNPHGRPNSDVIVPWVNGLDITRHPRNMFIIDFGGQRGEEAASHFEAPFEHVRQHVRPVREDNNRELYRKFWWRHLEPRPGMFAAIGKRPRFIGTARVAKHRLFVWLASPTLPDSQAIIFARDDDYFFGVLQSRLHEIWALKLGTRLETRPRYTPTTCFETFPFPESSPEQREEIAEAARSLDELRTRWLNPPEWTREEVLEFPGTTTGPWARYVSEADERGVGIVHYPRLGPRDDSAAGELSKRTLTNLYNQRPTWLALAHERLDAAVAMAYGWEPAMTDEQILNRLLSLNRQGGR
jgi:type II restriction/modification system DNA methylase subunit YeeA